MSKKFSLSRRKLKKLLGSSARKGVVLKKLVSQLKAGPNELSPDATLYSGWGRSQLIELLGSKSAKRLMNLTIPVILDEFGSYMGPLSVADVESARSLPPAA